MSELYRCPEVLALLHHARDSPEEDGPRLVLADFLEDHGDPAGADFIRWQCRLMAEAQSALSCQDVQECLDRISALLGRFGGRWAGPLWQWGGSVGDWHRGLLSLHLHRRLMLSHLEDILPWVDTVLLEAWSWQGLERAVRFLNGGSFNHVVLELRRPLLEEGILAHLSQVHESACLRTLSVGWFASAWGARPTRTARTDGVIGLGERFFARLASGLPLGRHLSHFVTRRPLLTVLAQACLRQAGIQVVQDCPARWPSHRLMHTTFRRQPPLALSD